MLAQKSDHGFGKYIQVPQQRILTLTFSSPTTGTIRSISSCDSA